MKCGSKLQSIDNISKPFPLSPSIILHFLTFVSLSDTQIHRKSPFRQHETPFPHPHQTLTCILLNCPPVSTSIVHSHPPQSSTRILLNRLLASSSIAHLHPPQSLTRHLLAPSPVISPLRHSSSPHPVTRHLPRRDGRPFREDAEERGGKKQVETKLLFF